MGDSSPSTGAGAVAQCVSLSRAPRCGAQSRGTGAPVNAGGCPGIARRRVLVCGDVLLESQSWLDRDVFDVTGGPVIAACSVQSPSWRPPAERAPAGPASWVEQARRLGRKHRRADSTAASRTRIRLSCRKLIVAQPRSRNGEVVAAQRNERMNSRTSSAWAKPPR